MVWITIILSIVSDLPQLIAVFKAIMAAIHGAPLGHRGAAIATFEANLVEWASRVKTDPAAVEAEVKAHAATFGLAV